MDHKVVIGHKANTFFKNVAIVFFITAVAKVIGFVKEAQLANTFGATIYTDAYSIALQIPTIIFDVLGVAVTTCFIPVASSLYAKGKKENRIETFNKFSSNVISTMMCISVGLLIITLVFSKEIVSLLAPGFTGTQYNVTLELVKVSSSILLFMPIVSCFSAILQVQDRFTLTSMLSIILNLPMMLYLCFGTDIKIAMVMTCIGYALEAIILVVNAHLNKFKFHLYISIRDEYFRTMMKMFTPILIGIGVKELNTIVDRMMASYLPAGNISVYNYASKIENTINMLVSSAFITVLFPRLSKMATDKINFSSSVKKLMIQLCSLVIPATVACVVLRTGIVELLYQRGNFSAQDTAATADVFAILAVGILFYGLRDYLNRVFYAMGETKIPTQSSVIALIINIFGNLLLVRIVGVKGLAIANVFSAIIVCVILIIRLRNELINFCNVDDAKKIFKIICASLIMCIVLWAAEYFLGKLGFSTFLSQIVDILVGGLTYGIVLYAFNLQEWREVTYVFIRKLRK